MTDQLYRAATDKEIIALAYVSLAVVPVEIDYEAAAKQFTVRSAINAALGIGGDDEDGS